jgi:hypothetical protein
MLPTSQFNLYLTLVFRVSEIIGVQVGDVVKRDQLVCTYMVRGVNNDQHLCGRVRFRKYEIGCVATHY